MVSPTEQKASQGLAHIDAFESSPEVLMSYSEEVLAMLAGFTSGSHLQMQAERNLIAAALVDKLNERFVLLSESCIPLYPAILIWAQLLSESRSRIHACSNASDSGDENRRMTFRSNQLSTHANARRQGEP